MELVIAILSIFFAAFPLSCVALLIWFADVYNRKPFWAAFIALAWGALGATLWSIIGSGIAATILGLFAEPTTVEFISAVVFAPVVEEFFKGIILLGLILIPRGYESATNGLVYGSMIGLGFAITENFLYYLSSYFSAGVGAWITTIILRTLFTSFVHVMATGSMGAALGYGASRGHNPWEMVIFGLGGYSIAVVIHGVWNLTATLSEFTSPAFFFLGILCFFIAFAVILSSAIMSIAYDRKVLKQELEEETTFGVLSLGDSIVISDFTKRNSLQYLFPGKLKDDYKKTAIRLAVIKRQNKIYPKAKRDLEIQSLRAHLKELQGHSTYYNAGPERPALQINRHVGLRSSDLLRRNVEMPEDSAINPPEPQGPHSVTILNPLEFRSRVRRENALDRGESSKLQSETDE
ncbi:MAG: PrsW family intramembrane metalloprotease [Sumerlaeia bacterium]